LTKYSLKDTSPQMLKSVFSIATMCRQRHKVDLLCWQFYLNQKYTLEEFKYT